MATGTETELRGASVHANGIEIHHVEVGDGGPVLVLDNAMVSTNPVWRGQSLAWASWLTTFAERFRVVAPDLRGSGKTVHPGGPISYDLLADDAAALVEALALDRPLVCGFSDGGEIATVLAIRHPDLVRGVVNVGGYDLFNPDANAPTIAMTRQMLGGSPDAAEADFDALQLLARRAPPLRTMFELMEADHDAGQGPGHWRTVVAQTFPRISQPHGYTAEHLRDLPVPMLIVVGDRDMFCPVEEGAALYRALPDGELAVLPATGHEINDVVVETIVEFFRRRS